MSQPHSLVLQIGQGNTPIKQINIKKHLINVKLEYLNPSGSHKDRGLTYQMGYYVNQGFNEFVISSSGNAGISSCLIANKFNLNLSVFISDKIPIKKKKRFEAFQNNPNIKIIETKEPKKEAIQLAKKNNAVLLRQSTSPYAYQGYVTLASEIIKAEPKTDAIFIPTSSGTTAVGIYYYFHALQKQCPPIHIVQTTKTHPIAKHFDTDFIVEKESLAKAIVDRVAHRKKELIEIIKATNGSGWVISNEEIKQLLPYINREEYPTSYEGILALAGFFKAIKKGYNFKKPLILFTGLRDD